MGCFHSLQYWSYCRTANIVPVFLSKSLTTVVKLSLCRRTNFVSLYKAFPKTSFNTSQKRSLPTTKKIRIRESISVSTSCCQIDEIRLKLFIAWKNTLTHSQETSSNKASHLRTIYFIFHPKKEKEITIANKQRQKIPPTTAPPTQPTKQTNKNKLGASDNDFQYS